jgi:tetratricopeptide (TPR) repeat protein
MEQRFTSFEEGIAAARDLLEVERFVEAEPVLRQLAQIEPAHEGVLDNLGWVLDLHGKLDDALAYYRNAVAHGAYPIDGDFDRIYEQAMIATRSCPTPLRRRARFHSLLEKLSTVLALDGGIVECGCFRGLSSHLMCGRLRLRDPAFRGGNYHIFDSFQGLGLPTPEDDAPAGDPQAEQVAKACKPGAFAAPLEDVRRHLAEFPEIEYHPGWIPLTFHRLPESGYRFIHLDVDLYDPTLSALEYFHPRLVRGGTIVCDDYGWPGARRAILEYCNEARVGYTVTDVGQAVIVRR